MTLIAFDLLELDGRDLRGEPIEVRKSELARLLDGCKPGIAINAVFDDPGPIVFERTCALGCEGIVSERRGSRYIAGRTDHWLKVKNPDAPAVRREFEDDRGRSRMKQREVPATANTKAPPLGNGGAESRFTSPNAMKMRQT